MSLVEISGSDAMAAPMPGRVPPPPPPPPMFDPKGAGRVICCLRPGQNKSSLKRFQCGKLTNAWEELQRHGEAQTYLD